MEDRLPVKLVVLGGSGAGKSCLVIRYINDQFDEFSEPTMGASFLSKNHQYGKDKMVTYQIWDTAGQEKYKSIAPIYYKDAQVALCIYDITSKQSFSAMKVWVNQLQAKGPENIIIAVVGNKIDLADEEQVPYNQAKEYAQSIDALFKLTSAKQGKGINQLFTAVAQRLDESQKKSSQAYRGTMRLKNTEEKEKQKHRKKCCK